MAGWKKGRWEHESSFSSFNQKLGILRAAHIGNLTDLQLAIQSDVPLNNEDVFSYDIERPCQQIRHLTARHKALFKINDTWRLSGQYVFQFNHRQEYDVVRSSGSAAQKPQLSFRLWSNSLDVALEHLPIRHWQGGLGVQLIQQTNFVGKGGLIPDYDAWGGSIWFMERRRRYPKPWELEFGVRYDYRQTSAVTTGTLNNLDTLVHFGSLSGTAGVIYHFNQALSATFNTGLAWRPPHVNELFARGVHQGAGTFEQGNPKLLSEKAWNSNLTLQWRKGRSEAMLSAFRNRMNDFIYLDPQNTLVLTVRGAYPAYFYAQADAVLKGMEGSCSLPVSKKLSIETRFSLLRAQRLLPDSSVVESGATRDWLPLMPADRLQYGMKWTIREKSGKVGKEQHESFVRLLANSTLRQSRIPAAGLLKVAPDGFTALTFDAAHTLLIHGKVPLEIGLTVQNLLNTRYREYLNFFRFYTDEPGLNAGIRAKITF
ncbi:MAG: TonB-dependent receptor [Saprospiraceae bacterium]|nr:TonB-dependent receptor [Saprospiraceae bacterium]